MPRTQFFNDAHVSGGSIWTRVLPEGETLEGQPDDAEEQPNRPRKGAQDQPADEEEDF